MLKLYYHFFIQAINHHLLDPLLNLLRCLLLFLLPLFLLLLILLLLFLLLLFPLLLFHLLHGLWSTSQKLFGW